jgi:hypothetical protein
VADSAASASVPVKPSHSASSILKKLLFMLNS